MGIGEEIIGLIIWVFYTLYELVWTVVETLLKIVWTVGSHILEYYWTAFNIFVLDFPQTFSNVMTAVHSVWTTGHSGHAMYLWSLAGLFGFVFSTVFIFVYLPLKEHFKKKSIKRYLSEIMVRIKKRGRV